MMSSLPPGSLLLLGGPLLAFLRGAPLKAALVLLPVLSFLHMWLGFELGDVATVSLYDLDLVTVRYDRLARIWGIVFHLAAVLAAVFALHVDDRTQHVAGLTYAGAAIAAVFAGDLVTLFVFWELTAVTSVFLIWATGTSRSFHAGMRYLVMQVLSGVLLLAGVMFRADAGLDLAFADLGLTGGVDTTLIFLAFGIKAAFPFLHGWLKDAYPEATPTGTVWLSAFTTKLAIYALARCFAGTEILIWIGAAMTMFPIFFAVIVNDLRRVLSYSLNNQLGYMVVGVGIGSELAINGAASHAFAHILYKGLLFMGMGAVLHRTGTMKGSELGGLYKTMPWTTGLTIVGAAAISGFPLTSGFVTKSMILSAAAEEHQTLVYLALLFASAGVFHHSGIKIPFFAFFAHDSGKRPEEAPWNMRVAMAVAAFFCVAIGVFPSVLYGLLPYPVDYVPYTWDHTVTMLQLLMGAALAFAVLNRIGAYPPELRSVVLDADWFYRRGIPLLADGAARVIALFRGFATGWAMGMRERVVSAAYMRTGPGSRWARTWSTGDAALSVALVLTLFALLFFRLGGVSDSTHAPTGAPGHGEHPGGPASGHGQY